ncbi:MAG TPA: radical SAM protein [Symbiobacteriaceae bacterium]|nr:radical SAM protein [Symbiobacteriaceae bacterium]
MSLSGLHFLLTYRCTESCDHCFVFGSPRAHGNFNLPTLCRMLDEGERLGTVDSIYFEGGEPFLLYDLLVASVREARSRGWTVGVVTNAFWATSPEAAAEKLRPLAALGLSDLSISDDELHGNIKRAATARAAARDLGIPADSLHVDAGTPGSVMYRGRAAEKLAGQAPGQHWSTFTCCPHEQLHDPGRVHLDAGGWVHLCQGLAMGNCLQTPLADLVQAYDPQRHPIVAPILKGGPAELARVFGLPDQELYADACHLCYLVRSRLRGDFPLYLAPGHVYGE